uniref:FACT complex subunit SSRP1 n=1 Tax=Spongospora subterranea TaxID=70186 RepID=A0A0H5RC47_9EUKA|eukprot:CRZ11182.1 hypothetical protein [Spongospora subterranea]
MAEPTSDTWEIAPDAEGSPSHKRIKREPGPKNESETIASVFVQLEKLVYENFSHQEWSKGVLAKLHSSDDSDRSVATLMKLIKSALSGSATSLTKKDKQCAKLLEKIQSLEAKLSKKNVHVDAMEKMETAKRAQEMAIGSAEKETLLVKIEGISMIKPWGKFDVSLYPSAMVLQGKKNEIYHVLISDIENVIAVSVPTSKDEAIVLPLLHSLTIGKTVHDVIAFKFKPKDTLPDSVVNSITSPFKGKSVEEFRAICRSGSSASESTAQLLAFVSNHDTVERSDESLFKSASPARTCIICHCKASHGVLFPLKSGLLFGLKPLIWLRRSQIDKTDFIRSSRYFELIVFMQGTGQTHSFEMIEIDEQPSIGRYLSVQKFGEGGRKQESVPNGKNEIHSEEDDENSSVDSDYTVNSGISSVPEDYDSELEESEDDDDTDDPDDDETEADEDAAEGDPDDNGLHSFAVVVDSDTE